jgi:hypothetical protein
MRKALQVLGVFLSFVFILFGTAMMAMNLEIILRPYPDFPAWSVYTIEFRSILSNGAPVFHLGWGLVAAGLTFLWFQRKKSD